MSSAMDKIFRGIQIIIAIFLTVMVIMVFANVVMRYIFNTGLAWSEEIARICFIYLVYLGTIDAFRDSRHLGVEMLVEKSKPKMQVILYLAIQIIVIWMMVILTIGSWALAAQGLDDKWVVTGYPLFLINGVGVVTGVAIIALALSNIYKLLVKKVPPLQLMVPKDNGEEVLMD